MMSTMTAERPALIDLPAERSTAYLRHPQSKVRIADVVVRHFPADYASYWEPFAGGAAVYFRLRHRPAGAAWLTDTARSTMETHAAVRDHVAPLLAALSEHQRADGVAHFRAVSQVVPDTLVGRAARHLYLASRVQGRWPRYDGQTGRQTVPLDAARLEHWQPIVSPYPLTAASYLLRDAKLSRQDYREPAPVPALSGVLIYCDPPYDAVDWYGRDCWGPHEHKELRNTVREWARHGAAVCLTVPDTPLMRYLYAEAPFHRRVLLTRGQVNRAHERNPETAPAARTLAPDMVVTTYPLPPVAVAYPSGSTAVPA